MRIKGEVKTKEEFHDVLSLLTPDSILLFVDENAFSKAFDFLNENFTNGFDVDNPLRYFEIVPIDKFIRRLSTEQLIELNAELPDTPLHGIVNPHNTRQIEQIIEDTIEACENVSPTELGAILRDCYGYDRFVVAYDTNSQGILVCH